ISAWPALWLVADGVSNPRNRLANLWSALTTPNCAVRSRASPDATSAPASEDRRKTPASSPNSTKRSNPGNYCPLISLRVLPFCSSFLLFLLFLCPLRVLCGGLHFFFSLF